MEKVKVWLTNVHTSEVNEILSKIEGYAFSGPPQASDTYTSDELGRMGMVGIYCYEDGEETGIDQS
jgi:hypothetical protein